jgi:hypothetical protein
MQTQMSSLMEAEMSRVFLLIADKYSIPFDEMAAVCGWGVLVSAKMSATVPEKELQVQVPVVQEQVQVQVQEPLVPQVEPEIAAVVKPKRQYKKKITEQSTEQQVAPETKPDEKPEKPKRQYKKKTAEQPPAQEKEPATEPATEKKPRATIDRGLTGSRLQHKMLLRMIRKSKADKTVSHTLVVVWNSKTLTYFNRETHEEYQTLNEANRKWCAANNAVLSGNVWTDFKLWNREKDTSASINTLHENDWISLLPKHEAGEYIDYKYCFPGETRRMTPILEEKEADASSQQKVTRRGRPAKQEANYTFDNDDNGSPTYSETPTKEYRTSEDEDSNGQIDLLVENFNYNGIEYYKSITDNSIYPLNFMETDLKAIGKWCDITKTIIAPDYESDLSDDE